MHAKDIYYSCLNFGLTEAQAWAVVDANVELTTKSKEERDKILKGYLSSINFDDANEATKAAILEIVNHCWESRQSSNPEIVEEIEKEIIFLQVEMVVKNLELWKEYINLILGSRLN